MEETRMKNILKNCVEEICRTAQYGYGMYTDLDSLYIVFDNSVQKINKTGIGEGIILNAWNGSGFEEYATTNLDQDNLVKHARILGVNNPFQKNGTRIDPGAVEEQTFPIPGKIDPRTIPLEEKVEKVRRLQEKARQMHPGITNAVVRYLERKEHFTFVNRARIYCQTIFRFLYRLEYTVSDKGKTNSWMTGFNGTGGYEDVKIPEQKIEETLKNAFELVAAESITPGTYDVIVDPETTGVIAHEAFGHGVENDVVLKQRSKAKEFMGKQIGSELVNMTDDPLREGAYGFYYFDDEGQPAETTRIIVNGILQQGLSDHYSAIHLNVPDCGNGRRENFTHKPYSRMSNTFLEAGDCTLEQMIGDMEDGLYIIQGTNGMEDPKNWGIQVEAKMAREIKNGKLTGRNFAPVGITGYVPDLLMSISQVGNDFGTAFGGTCIKGYKEHVPVAVGGASMRIKGRIS